MEEGLIDAADAFSCPCASVFCGTNTSARGNQNMVIGGTHNTASDGSASVRGGYENDAVTCSRSAMG